MAFLNFRNYEKAVYNERINNFVIFRLILMKLTGHLDYTNFDFLAKL
jgi:hypothetical protein